MFFLENRTPGSIEPDVLMVWCISFNVQYFGSQAASSRVRVGPDQWPWAVLRSGLKLEIQGLHGVQGLLEQIVQLPA
ncbi:MAG: hypothetical protein IIU32_08610, partial [Firmicutes bacterium]|nr:hypothetical protein [Bacillota bacterium]